MIVFRRREPEIEAPLTDEEEERLRRLAHSGDSALVPPQAAGTNSADL
jgi:hypothetical protein